MAGWIKISREIANHWLWQDAERLKWWLDLLFLAAYEDKQVLHDSHLFVLRRGQIIASISFLSERWGKSHPTIIKFLRLLEGEDMIKRITIYRQTSILTICNYEKYQCNDDSTLNTQIDSIVDRQNDEKIRGKVDKPISEVNIIKSDSLGYKGETKVDTIVDSQVYTIVDGNKEYKNNNSTSISSKGESKNLKFIEELKNAQIWLEQMAMRFHIPIDEIVRRLDDFALDCDCRGTEHQDFNDTRRHFNDWLRIQLEAEKRKNNVSDRQNSENKRRGSDVTATSAEDYEGAF
jgi:DNA-binding Lrp family transcriptional regulator